MGSIELADALRREPIDTDCGYPWQLVVIGMLAGLVAYRVCAPAAMMAGVTSGLMSGTYVWSMWLLFGRCLTGAIDTNVRGEKRGDGDGDDGAAVVLVPVG